MIQKTKMKTITGYILSLLVLISCQDKTHDKVKRTDQYTCYSDSLKIFLDPKSSNQVNFANSHKTDSLNFYNYLKNKNLYPYNKLRPFHDKVLLNNKFELIEFIEPILFRIYGKKNIIGERPYFVCLVGDYWFLRGSLPKDMLGGVFEMTINRKTCEIIYLIHGK